MDDKTKKKLSEIFDNYDKENLDKKRVQEKIKSDQDIFLENYAEVVATVIRPALREFSEAIKTRGQQCMITENDGSSKISVGISLKSPESYSTSSGRDYPFITFNASTADKSVWIRISTIAPNHGGSTGNGGNYKLNQMTLEIVEKEVTGWLEKCFNRTY